MIEFNFIMIENSMLLIMLLKFVLKLFCCGKQNSINFKRSSGHLKLRLNRLVNSVSSRLKFLVLISDPSNIFLLKSDSYSEGSSLFN